MGYIYLLDCCEVAVGRMRSLQASEIDTFNLYFTCESSFPLTF